MIPIEHLLLGTALFLCLSVAASKLAARFGIPALLLFLLIGMLAGSDGPGGIYFDNPWLAQAVGVVALALILFAGGLDTRLDDIRPVFRRGLILATLGVSITALAVGWFASVLLGVSLLEGILLGAIISSTDAAAVLTLLRGKGVHLKRGLKPLLEFESGSNDPMAVFLTLGMIRLLQEPQLSVLNLIPMFVQQMALGGLLGYLLGKGMVLVINRVRLEYDGLYSVLMLALVLLIYGITTVLGGNGFLAVYVAGLWLGNRDFIHQRSLRRFMDGIAWLMQIVMFLTLGLQVFPSELPQVAPAGLLIAAFLIFAARPVSVLVSLAFARMQWRERLFVAWVGLRGAAPIILATFPLLAGVSQADMIFNLVFFIVLTSVLFQGTLIVPAARLLSVEARQAEQPHSPLAFVMDDGKIASDLMELMIPVDSEAVGKRILNLQLPRGVLVVLVGRGGEMIVPDGSTVLEAGDTLLLLAPPPLQSAIRDRLTRPAAIVE
ncbi:MAG: potassium/proton antiporter [Chloroflexi bacterium]|nr:potassium/proton antiporter [Chloroflexota bacterium]